MQHRARRAKRTNSLANASEQARARHTRTPRQKQTASHITPGSRAGDRRSLQARTAAHTPRWPGPHTPGQHPKQCKKPASDTAKLRFVFQVPEREPEDENQA
eukprot:297029-Rhodomonas_salina.4